MASRIIYPPLVNSYEPAFVTDAGSDSSLRVYFSFSSLSKIPADTKITVHAQIYRQDGVKVVNTTNDISTDPAESRYRATGIILNLKYYEVGKNNNLYYVIIKNSDLKSSVGEYNGWIPGWVYKIQLRLSTRAYDPSIEPKQEVWLQRYSEDFSEWSTVCYTKAISSMRIQIPIFEYDSKRHSQLYNPDYVYILKGMDFSGTIESTVFEANEDYEYITVSLYREDTLLEESGEIYKTEQSNTYFSYQFKYNIQNEIEYKLLFNYKTENGYIPDTPLSFNFFIKDNATEIINAKIITVDKDPDNLFKDLTSIDEEEDEGRIGLKIYSPTTDHWSGNICIRRASQKDGFQNWEDITIFTVKEKDLNTLDLIYDYTIESGVWYKYGIQSIDKNGTRGVLVIMETPIQRLFNYSFILGKEGKQLKLQFNNTVNSFKHQIYDSKIDTIGSKYPFIARNAAVNYRSFPINALISFWMDENNTFLKNGKKDIYGSSSIVELYDNYVQKNSIRKQYDYTYERDFRKMVLDFLQDGKPKLFKSPTEGNIIVRLMDVNCTPNQTLDRMIYSVTMNAHEIDDDTMNNYLKYGFYNPGSYSNDLSVISSLYLGQINGTFTPNDNIFQKIYEQYDRQNQNLGGYARRLNSIEGVRITINGYYFINDYNEIEYSTNYQLRIYNNQNELVLGNNISVSYGSGVSSIITIYDESGIYEFDSLIKFYYTNNVSNNDSLYLLGDAEGKVVSIDATIDFLYSLNIETFATRQIDEYRITKGISQYYEETMPGISIYKTIYSQHYVESNSIFRRLNSISNIEIEANPHTVFAIKDENETEEHRYEINDTGILNLNNFTNIIEIKYIGKRYFQTDYDDSTLSAEIITEDILDNEGHVIVKAATDVSITYYYSDIQGTYKEA